MPNIITGKRRRNRQFPNLLESVKPNRRAEAIKRFVEQVAANEIRVDLGTFRESIGSSVFATLTADLMHKRAMKAYETVPGAQDWRKLVSDITSANDFRFQNAVRLTELSLLRKVEPGGMYHNAYFTDEATKWKLAKYGDLLSVQMEAMANDELGKLGKGVEKLSRAAKRLLLDFVFSTLVDDNPTMLYDSVTLFHANHSNNLGATTPLNQANFETAWKKLTTQTGTAGEPLGLVPKYLIVHPDEAPMAWRIQQSAGIITADAGTSSTTFIGDKNVFAGKFEVIVSQYVTSGRWYLAADPMQVDTLEVGFYLGRQEPEIFVENSGSAAEFETDTMRWKVRTMFGGVGLDHRWIVRGNVA